MSSAIPKLTTALPKPPEPPPAPTHAPAAEANAPRAVHLTHTQTQTAALSPTDVSYVDSLMGTLPAQKMEEVLLRTGIPMPAHLGQGLDAAV